MLVQLFAVAAALSSGVSDPLLDKQVASVLPTAKEETWLQIPWRMDLTSARIEAQQSQKPMFLWMMNGNPLGST
ncbi:MAG: hypothetical protein ACR2HJ_01505 [Fimbriimonadales bacterium]